MLIEAPKTKYNQGDMLRFTWVSGESQLIVILGVISDLPCGVYHYKTLWLEDNSRELNNIKGIDDNRSITLAAQ